MRHPCNVVGCSFKDCNDVKTRHALPKDPRLRAVWLERIGLSESVAPKSARVCGRHFPTEAYLYNPEFVRKSAVGFKNLHLRKNTVPTLFLPKPPVPPTVCHTDLRLVPWNAATAPTDVVSIVPPTAPLGPSKDPPSVASATAPDIKDDTPQLPPQTTMPPFLTPSVFIAKVGEPEPALGATTEVREGTRPVATAGILQAETAPQCDTSAATKSASCCTEAGLSKETQCCPIQLVSTGTQAATPGRGTSSQAPTKIRRLTAYAVCKMFHSLSDSTSDASDDSADDFEAPSSPKSASTYSREKDDSSVQVASEPGTTYKRNRLAKKVCNGETRVDCQNRPQEKSAVSLSGWTTQKPSDSPEPGPNRSPVFSQRLCAESTPSDAFGLYFDTEVWQMIVDETNAHAEREGQAKDWQPLSVREFKAYVGMLVMMSIHHLPRVSLYWSSDRFFNVGEISSVMPYKRFQQITAHLHLNGGSSQLDTSCVKRNKCYSHLVALLNDKFRKEYKPSSHLAVYRSQMLFEEQASVEQGVPVNPQKTSAYKVCMLSDSETGYLCKLDVLQGCHESRPPGRTLSERVALSLVEDVVDEGCQLYLDNFFSSPKLLLELRERGVCACGAFRSSRRDVPIEVRSGNNGLPRGAFVYRSNGPVCAYQWRDRKNFHVMSNFHDPEAVVTVERKPPCGRQIRVPCPTCVRDYYQWMGGAKRFEQKLSTYPVDRKSRKGWHGVFYLLVDTAVINAFVQCTASRGGNGGDLIQFKLELGRQLINGQTFRDRGIVRVGCQRKRGRTTGTMVTGGTKEVRFGEGCHFRQVCATRGQCRWCSTKEHEVRTKYLCSACEVPLCAKCFAPFHADSTS